MPSPSKCHGDFRGVHLFQTASRHEVNAVLHLRHGKNNIEVFHLHQLVHKNSEIPHVIVAYDFRKDNFDAVNDMCRS